MEKNEAALFGILDVLKSIDESLKTLAKRSLSESKESRREKRLQKRKGLLTENKKESEKTLKPMEMFDKVMRQEIFK